MPAPSNISDRTSSTANMTNGSVAVRWSTRPDDSVLFHSLKYTTVDTISMHATSSQRTLPSAVSAVGPLVVCSIFRLENATQRGPVRDGGRSLLSVPHFSPPYDAWNVEFFVNLFSTLKCPARIKLDFVYILFYTLLFYLLMNCLI